MMHASGRIRVEGFGWFLGVSLVIHLASLVIPVTLTFHRQVLGELWVEFTQTEIARDVSQKKDPDDREIEKILPKPSATIRPVSQEEAKALLQSHTEAF